MSPIFRSPLLSQILASLAAYQGESLDLHDAGLFSSRYRVIGLRRAGLVEADLLLEPVTDSSRKVIRVDFSNARGELLDEDSLWPDDLEIRRTKCATITSGSWFHQFDRLGIIMAMLGPLPCRAMLEDRYEPAVTYGIFLKAAVFDTSGHDVLVSVYGTTDDDRPMLFHTNLRTLATKLDIIKAPDAEPALA